MKGRNFSVKAQRARYVAMDFVTVSVAFFLFNIFRFNFLHFDSISLETTWHFLTSQKLIVEQIVIPIGMLGIFWLSGYYNHPVVKSRLSELTVTFWSIIFSTILIYLILLINDTTGLKSLDYEIILALFGFFFVLVYIGRWALTTIKINNIRKRNWHYNTLIIGNSRKSRAVYKRLKSAGSVWVYDVVGFIRLSKERNIQDDFKSWDWEEIENVCQQMDVDQIILAPENIKDNTIMKLLERLFPLNIPVKIAPDSLSYVTGNLRLSDILGIPFIDVTSPRMSEFEKNVKRLFDVTASILTLILLSPALMVIAMCVKLSSKGPVIYSQERIGKGHKPFRILKFRSMVDDAEIDGPMLSSQDDHRVTPFGKIMRKYRLDELPQFWNVLKGEMSLVGPRPEREFYIKQILKKAPYFGLIFQVRPGVTSWGMVKYGYASTISQMVERSRYDLLYINNMSLSTDIKIMIYTIRTVLKGAGV